MKKIILNQEKFAIIDDEDYAFISQFKWRYERGYAVRNQHIGIINGVQKKSKIYMHRLINKTPDDTETDHINQNKLDNRKSNLRSVPRTLNQINRGKQKNNTSGFKGVSWNTGAKKWRACIKKNNIKYHLGYFILKEDAAKAYDAAAINKYGSFAKTNFLLIVLLLLPSCATVSSTKPIKPHTSAAMDSCVDQNYDGVKVSAGIAQMMINHAVTENQAFVVFEQEDCIKAALRQWLVCTD